MSGSESSERAARFKSVLDAACADGGKVKIHFTPSGIASVRELKRMVERGLVSTTFSDERFLSTVADSGDADGCSVVIQFTSGFQKKRGEFDKKILPGVETLAPAE